MDHAALVRVREGAGDLRRRIATTVSAGSPSTGSDSDSGRPPDVLHRDEGAAVGFTDFVDRADVRVIQV